MDEVSAGYVLFRRGGAGGEPAFLLLQNARHHTWGVPKGHLEPGEGERQGADRELLEETGLRAADARVVEGLRQVMEYDLPHRSGGGGGGGGRRRRKRVVLFAAEVGALEPRISDEHSAWRWVSLAEAAELISFEDLLAALRRVDAWARGPSSTSPSSW
ncbi:MAG: NUDIX domain-containing protein [Planctomycetes bacterium]|nr:NUDIX domain-containing protein [Planctomycetota bacterium]